VAVGSDTAVATDQPAHLATDVILESLAIHLGLEADQIVGAECLEQLIMRRNGGEYFRRRKGNVQKEADAVADAQAPAFLGEGDQVVVVYPDHIVRQQQRLQLLGEHAIYLAITLVLLATVAR